MQGLATGTRSRPKRVKTSYVTVLGTLSLISSAGATLDFSPARLSPGRLPYAVLGF